MLAYTESLERRRRHGWRWWRWDYRWRRRPAHDRPHIGRRRNKVVRVSAPVGEEGDIGFSLEPRPARGRPRLFKFHRPAYLLHLETVWCGPYEEHYAGYEAECWWWRRIVRSRERRGWPRERLHQRLYRPHPLQGGRA